jgi:RNA polymerase primary sigma factor
MGPPGAEEALVATSTRALSRGLKRTSSRSLEPNELVEKLRRFQRTHGQDMDRSALAEFLTHQRLTHRDVNALLAALSGDVPASARDQPSALGQWQAPAPAPSPTIGSASAATPARRSTCAPVRSEPCRAVEPTSCTTQQDRTSRKSQPTGETTAPDNDIAWMFDIEPQMPTPRNPDDVLGRAFDDLQGDWQRQGGHLTRADVALLACNRGLSPLQQGELLDLLDSVGIEVADHRGQRQERAAALGTDPLHDGLSSYLREIARYPLINAVREIELWSLISQGIAAQKQLDDVHRLTMPEQDQRSLQTQADAGRNAHAELVCANLRLVASIAKANRYFTCGVEILDRIQDGNLGLMHAADKFDGSKGFKFSTYATWWIRQSIERGVADRGRTIRLPVHAHEKMLKVRTTVRRLAAKIGHEPTLSQIAETAGITPGAAQALLDLDRPVISLDCFLGEERDIRFLDLLVVEGERDDLSDPASIVMYLMMREDLLKALGEHLSARETEILKRRFGIDSGQCQTLDEIGSVIGVTRERIRQVQKKSLQTLYECQAVHALRAYYADDVQTDRACGYQGGGIR